LSRYSAAVNLQTVTYTIYITKDDISARIPTRITDSLLSNYCPGNQIKKNEMVGTCSTYREEEKCTQGFGGGNLKERDHLEDPGIDGTIILKWIIKKLDGGMDWIVLAKDRDRWREIVNVIMNFRFA
jgi:hypothetical protein